ncbi:Glycoside hydrolase family 7, partial [Trinorchestia longiramus]
GSRSYLVTSEEKYRMFNLKNREFTVDIDTSNLECGMNGGLYFSEMPEDGGTSAYPTNQAGAKYGTGYCDGQCFHWIRYSGGQVNIQGNTDYGVCCIEMDIWESNK